MKRIFVPAVFQGVKHSLISSTKGEVAGSVGRGRPKKTWEEVIKMDLRERRVSKDLARDT